MRYSCFDVCCRKIEHSLPLVEQFADDVCLFWDKDPIQSWHIPLWVLLCFYIHFPLLLMQYLSSFWGSLFCDLPCGMFCWYVCSMLGQMLCDIPDIYQLQPISRCDHGVCTHVLSFDFFADGKYVAFLWVKHLFPLLLPYCWFVEIFMQLKLVASDLTAM